MNMIFESSRSQMFYKIGFSYKIRKILMKTSITLLKRDPSASAFFLDTEHLWTAASGFFHLFSIALFIYFVIFLSFYL